MEEKKSAHIPKRMCIGCREMKDKFSLIRIVDENEGPVIDISGKIQKRGAYICKCEGCINMAQKKKALNRCLKKSIDEEFYKELKAYAAG